MIAPRSEPFPFEAVRDLLGILRALYASLRAQGDRRRLNHIRRIGQELRTAVDLALEYEPGTMGHAAAWQRAESATRELGDLVDCTTPIEPALQAAAARIRPTRDAANRHELTRRQRTSRG
jgi:hypothetical protein